MNAGIFETKERKMSEVILNSGNFEAEVLKSDKPVLVDFFATWCGPCKMTAPHVARLADAYKDSVKVCKLDVDEAPDVAQRFGISSIPTILVFKNGEVINTHIGSAGYPLLESLVRNL